MADPERPTLPEGGRVGAYRLERRLGGGGMGEVFLAQDERLGRWVALKRIRQGSAPEARERFRREARAAARLNHPAVVQIYDVLENPAADTIVMEYAEGRTLRELLAHGLPALDVTVRLAREIAEGLAAAHSAGLVHRDLKAENIVVTPEGHAKILDFGLAKAFEAQERERPLTGDGALLGTLHAMSPEQASGGEIDARSDLFSLGALLYEMLIGRPPFLGSNAPDTLRRVLSHQPPPVGALRPDLPAELADLAERLLAKDREVRPRSAREVARVLEAVEPVLSPAGPREGHPIAEQATEVEIPLGGIAVEGPGSWQPGDSASGGFRPVRSRRRYLLIPAVLAIVAVTAFLLAGRLAPGPLRIAVLRPEVAAGGGGDLGLAASGVVVSALSALGSLEGVVPLDPAQVGNGEASPVQTARSTAADEVLAATVEGQGAMGARVTLRRIQGSDGRVLWAASFNVPSDPRDLRLLADAVAVHLRRGFPERRPRAGTPELDVRDADYGEFLRVKSRVDSGTVPLEPELARLEGIVSGSPRFLEAHLLAANLGQTLFRSSRDPSFLDRARTAAEAARRLAPGDPRPLIAQFRVALAGERPEEAHRLLSELEQAIPADPELFSLSGQLAEQEGRMDRALADYTEAARRIPSWNSLFRLADLESRTGRIAEARQHLQELLRRGPDNVWGLDKLGTLELLTGEPADAERIYLDLIRLRPQRSYYTNLGLARSLLGRDAEAREAYRQALKLAPGHVAVILNLADAELVLGREAEARSLYGQALRHLEESETAAGLSPVDGMIKAQCLVHLGRTQEAVASTQETLRRGGDDPEVAYMASLVYALAGDRASALV
ncbi:MAG TPA: protein kinase, partial [Thermoanaerobaculia bacterium]|nr:protein kinase [Thermoanaerobaculia bacterium]